MANLGLSEFFDWSLYEVSSFTLKSVPLRERAFFVLNSIRPPIESASLSAVSDLYTSIESRSSVGSPSNITFLPPSGAGTIAPLTAIAFKSPDKPLILTYLPSPWSFSTVIPDSLLIASAAVVSGKSPNASESTTDTIKLDSLCLSIAEIMLAFVPTVTTSSTLSSDSWEVVKIESKSTDSNEDDFFNIIYLKFICLKFSARYHLASNLFAHSSKLL